MNIEVNCASNTMNNRATKTEATSREGEVGMWALATWHMSELNACIVLGICEGFYSDSAGNVALNLHPFIIPILEWTNTHSLKYIPESFARFITESRSLANFLLVRFAPMSTIM